MVIGPAELASKKYDLVIVDEAHRLRRRVNLGSYFNAFDKASEKLGFDKEVNTELDWVLKQSQKSLLFYDRFQTIKPSDVARTQFEELEHSKGTRMEVLKNQFRSKGGNDFVSFIYDLLDGNSAKLKRFQHPHFELKLFEDLQEMQDAIREQERVHQLSRLVAGYAWEWISKKNPTQKAEIEAILSAVIPGSSEISNRTMNEINQLIDAQKRDVEQKLALISTDTSRRAPIGAAQHVFGKGKCTGACKGKSNSRATLLPPVRTGARLI
jgi:hypothetical protein